MTTEVYDQDGKYGQKFIFTGVPLTEFDDEDLKITREGDFFVVNGTLDLSDSTGAESSDSPLPLPSSLTAGFEVAVSMTFPGEVVEHNGTLEGTTVTWKPKAGENARHEGQGEGDRRPGRRARPHLVVVLDPAAHRSGASPRWCSSAG